MYKSNISIKMYSSINRRNIIFSLINNHMSNGFIIDTIINIYY